MIVVLQLDDRLYGLDGLNIHGSIGSVNANSVPTSFKLSCISCRLLAVLAFWVASEAYLIKLFHL